MNLKSELQARILNNGEIELRKSRFSDVEAFFVGTREIAHFHDKKEIDVRVTKAMIKKMGFLKSNDSRVHVRSASSDWVEVKFSKESDLNFILEIVDIAARENLKQLKSKRS